jgi:transposase
MVHSVTNIPCPIRRRLSRVAQRSADPLHVRRPLAILALGETQGCASEAARRVCAARSTINRWRSLYEEYGEEGLEPRRRGRTQWKCVDEVVKCLEALLEDSPQSLGYLRSRWSSELLAKEVKARTGVTVHASTVRRCLARLRFCYRRARPMLHICDPRKAERIRAIETALLSQGNGTEVFYVDEADVDLNPRIGPAWVRCGTQQAIPTPGKNRKHYVAGALNARTGRLIWTEYERKSTLLSLGLLHQLRRGYRAAKPIVLIADNYIIHKSEQTQRWLAQNPKFHILFQPVYHPWVNKIERLWKSMHDNVTRNHRCRTIKDLMGHVRRFLEVCQPYPGNGHALAVTN